MNKKQYQIYLIASMFNNITRHVRGFVTENPLQQKMTFY